jgi:hypothetical protein
VLDSLTGVLLTAEQDGVGTSGSTKGKLIKGDDLSASLDNTGLGGLGDTQASNRQLGDLEEADIISHGANDNSGLALLASQVASNTRDGHWGAVDARHEETLQDNLVEGRIRTAGKESVELFQDSSSKKKREV